ncbi:cilia- and flagella-associated protein 99, partial [Andrena cerasifolii]|uniref:cilia- and flagella-associated protein 99 n=1 Tax=Andrena cerasifolii TaxID=2819439 RepID=UPI004037A49C
LTLVHPEWIARRRRYTLNSASKISHFLLHCNCPFLLEKANVFQLSILLPLMKILDIYMAMEHELSPDEFCLLLFAREEAKGKCKLDVDPLKSYAHDPEEFKALSVSVQSVIVDLFMNIIRHESFLEAVSKDILEKQQCRNYDDLHQTMALVYILAYRIFSLFFENSIECFVHFKLKKMLFLVSYLLRPETSNMFYQKGCSIYEVDFVEQKLIFPFLEATSYLEKLHDQIKRQIQNTKPRKKEVTIPKFMKVLNRPRLQVRAPPPSPVDVSMTKFFRHVPRTNYVKPSTESKLQSLRAANKLHAMNLLKDANENAPSCSQRRKSLARSTEGEKPTATFVRKSAPTFKPVEVKQTAASILRECARVITDEEKEIKKLKELAEGGLDPSAILKLEEEKRKERREEELLKIQEKHLLALLTREGAFIAKKSLLNDVKLHTDSVRKEKQELYEKLEKWREDYNKGMMEIVEKCREIEQSSREAFNAMIDEKRQRAAEVSEESRQLKAQLFKQREDETQRKIKMIQEIKTIQSLRALPLKDFDPTETSGLGLLCEMSLAELRERLFWMKMKLNEEMDNRKAVVSRERERQKNLIEDTRRALEEYKASKRVAPPFKPQQRSAPVTSVEIEALRKKLEERRALRVQADITRGSKLLK